LDSNNKLIKLIAEGNKEAFQQLYILYASKIYNIAISYSKNIEEAEEITQDVFLKIYKNASKFKGNSTLNTWIYRITVNTSLNALKKKKKIAFLQFGQIIEQPDFEHPGVKLENKENAKLLFQVIDTLSHNQKTAFILSYIEELPRQEVADIMQTSLKAVESLLQRAKKSLRKKLEKLYPNRRIFKK